MPISARKPCSHAGCNVLVRGVSRCDKHKSDNKRLVDQNRGSASERGYGHKWRKAREGFLKKHPLCVSCESTGITTAAVVVDHIIPHRGNKDIFWDRDNWQPLCKSCHDRKTATIDVGFGRYGGLSKVYD